MNIEIIAAFITGSFAGSFFHTLGERYLNGSLNENPLKALFSRSRCPECGKVIGTLFLIPVFGYLIARAKCTECGGGISPAYPVSEIIHALTFASVVRYEGISITAVLIYLILACALTASRIDLKSMIMPDFLNAAVFILALYPALSGHSLTDPLYGFALMFVFFLVILLIFPGSFGGGDLKFAAACGFFLGLELSIIMLEVALISGALTGIVYAVTSGKGLRSKIPFGPFLTLGLFTAYFFGRDIILIYYSFTG